MIHRHGGSFISTMTETNRWVQDVPEPQAGVRGHAGLPLAERDQVRRCDSAGLHHFEHADISEWTAPGGYGHGNANTNHRVIIYQHKCIEPLWESKPDWEIYKALAERLGFLDEYTEGNSEEDWIKKIFYYSDLPKHISYEDFKKRATSSSFAGRLQAYYLQPLVLRRPPLRYPRTHEPQSGHG